MATIHRFEDLEIWKLARVLENEIWKIIRSENFCNDFRLINQINGATGSVMDNIAEGFGRGSRLEFINSLSIAKGEANEVQSQLYRCLDRNYITEEKFKRLYQQSDEIIKKIGALILYLNKTEMKGQKFQNRTKTPNS